MNVRIWIIFSGLVWFAIGSFLLYKGLKLIAGGSQSTLLLGIGLIIGFLKGRFVLSKTVMRVVSRIVSLPQPIRFKQVYAPSYYLLIGFMMSLGMLFRFLPISVDFRGCLDVAIGSALITGSILYFRLCGKSFLSQFLERGRSVQSE